MTTQEREEFFSSNIFPKGKPLLKWEYADAMGINRKNFSRDMKRLCQKYGYTYASSDMVFYIEVGYPDFVIDEDILEFGIEE